MKHDKKRRKKLKRRIWVAAAGLVMLGGFYAWTIHAAWVLSYGWQANATGNFSKITIRTAQGGMGAVLQRDFNFKIKEGVQFNDNNGYIGWHGWLMKASGNDRYWDVSPTSHEFRFAGFQFVSTLAHQVLSFHDIEFDQTFFTVWLPLWVWALPPAFLIVLWSLQLKRAGRKDSAFPVITE